jgi:23S rRNA-/tRNA-specific pseudouridylate synthase
MSLTAAVLGTLSQNALAESSARVFKTLDGAVSRCGVENSVENKLGSKNVLVELVGESASQKNHGTSLKVSVVKCDGGKWVLDQDPAKEKYTAPNGESVEVQYSDYEVMIVDKGSNIVAVESLGAVKTSSEEQITASIAKNNDNPQDLEVIVRAKKSVKASGGFSSESTESFGSFRLRITN